MLTIIPVTTETVVHVIPKFTKGKLRFILELFLKFLPFIILLISYYLIHTEKKYRHYREIERVKEINDIATKIN